MSDETPVGDDGCESKRFSRKELARERRRAAYLQAKERRKAQEAELKRRMAAPAADDFEALAMRARLEASKEKARVLRRAAYQKAKERRQADREADKARAAEAKAAQRTASEHEALADRIIPAARLADRHPKGDRERRDEAVDERRRKKDEELWQQLKPASAVRPKLRLVKCDEGESS